MSRSSTTIRRQAKARLIANPHPGEILLEDFLKPLGLSQNALGAGDRRAAAAHQ